MSGASDELVYKSILPAFFSKEEKSDSDNEAALTSNGGSKLYFTIATLLLIAWYFAH